MEATTQSTETAQIAMLHKHLALESQLKSGINWFYWIAALSLINSVIFLAGGSLSFISGLAITQVIDAFADVLGEVIAEDFGPSADLIMRSIGFVLDLMAAGVFIGFGLLGRKRYQWVVIVGLVLYALDTLILVAFTEWVGVIFHLFALWGIWGGLKAIRNLKALEATQTPDQLAAIQQSIAAAPTSSRPPFAFKRFIAMAAPILIPMLCLLVLVAILVQFL